MVEIKIKKNNEEAVLPTRGSNYAAGWDLYANLTKRFPVNSAIGQTKGCYYNYPDGTMALEIYPHSTMMVSTGLSMSIPENYWGGIYARSGLSTKQGLRPANCVGVIDADYRGDVIVALHNDSDKPKMILHHDRIAQFVLHQVNDLVWDDIGDEELDETVRGADGFGKTGR